MALQYLSAGSSLCALQEPLRAARLLCLLKVRNPPTAAIGRPRWLSISTQSRATGGTQAGTRGGGSTRAVGPGSPTHETGRHIYRFSARDEVERAASERRGAD